MGSLKGKGVLEPLAAAPRLTLELHLHLGRQELPALVSALRRMLLAVRVVSEAPAVELFLGGKPESMQCMRQQLGAVVREVGEAWAAARLPGSAGPHPGVLVVPDVTLDNEEVDAGAD